MLACVRYRGDGEMLIGMRRFTRVELEQYCKNMYGNRWRSRLAIKNNKLRPHKQCVETAYKAWETKRLMYTQEQIDEFYKRAAENRRANPNWRAAQLQRVQRMKTPEAITKYKETVRRKRANGTWYRDDITSQYRYFICDCEVDGHEFKEGEAITIDDKLYEKAHNYGLVFFYYQLPDDTKKIANNLMNRARGRKYACRHWFDKRPDIIFKLFVV